MIMQNEMAKLLRIPSIQPFLLFILLIVLNASASVRASDTQVKTNVLLILADDLGFSDLGCYGGEIDTPHLDALAKNGLRFTRFYNTARCWPTRGSILTGYYAQQIRRDAVPGVQSGNPGVRPAWARLLPELLKPHGYHSYHSGKWHIDGQPLQNGFEHSYSLNDHDRHFAPKKHTQDDKPLPGVEPTAGYYSSCAIADHSIAQLTSHFEKYPDKPFFGFVAFTAPHFPVQAPPEDVAKYKKKYLAGWDAMREQRWKRMKDLSLGDTLSAIERNIGPPYAFPDAIKKLGPNELNRPVAWEDLTPEQKSFQADKMAVHAAMVDRMDQEIGRILSTLRKSKKLDDTLVVFLSDNGASAEIMVRGDGHDPHAECGTGATFLSIGPGWSSLCNTPFRRHKSWVHEGGIHTPFVVHWPKGISAKGEVRHTQGHVVDIVPTVLELATGKAVARPVSLNAPVFSGRSLLPAFAKDGAVQRDSLWWLHEGNRALRMGEWKIVAAGTESAWELYDLKADPTETRNMAKEQPEKVRELNAEWQRQTEEYFAQAKKHAPAAPRKEPVSGKMAKAETFEIDRHKAYIYASPKPGEGKPWIWYAPTINGSVLIVKHKVYFETFMEAGVAVAGFDLGEVRGAPESTTKFTQFYDAMVNRGYSRKPILLGQSRGGLMTLTWATANPEKVKAWVGIYPVCNLTSWPLKSSMKETLADFKLTQEQLLARLREFNPIDNLDGLAKHKVPMFAVHGDKDGPVPYDENTKLLKQKYEAAGGTCDVKVIPGAGHAEIPAFFECRELIDFVRMHSKK